MTCTITYLPREVGQTDENYFEIGQRELRKGAVKKISFKIKKSSSTYRKNFENYKKMNVIPSQVAQLTQKFNNMVAQNIDPDKPSNCLEVGTKFKHKQDIKSDICKANQVPTTNIKQSRKPSVRTKPNLDAKSLVILKTKPVVKDHSIKKQHSLKETSTSVKQFLTSSTKPIDEDQKSDIKKLLQDGTCEVVCRNNSNNNNIVQTTIKIFERKSLNENNLREISNRINVLHKRDISNIFEDQNKNKESDETEIHTPNFIRNNFDISTAKHKESIPNIPFNSLSSRRCDSMYEPISSENKLYSLKSKSAETITKFDFSIKPNNSFLWSDKSPTNSYSTINPVTSRKEMNEKLYKIDNEIPPKLPPKLDISTDIVETFNPQFRYRNFDTYPGTLLNETNGGTDLLKYDEETYEKFNIDGYECISTKENIYEVMPGSPTRSNQGEANSSVDLTTTELNETDGNEEIVSNSYDTISDTDYKRDRDKDRFYESIYEHTKSFSNRDSLISSEQNSNSLYGKNLWESEDDNSTYKAISDISDEWVDITDNEENHYTGSGLIIIREKHRSKKSWSEHLRGQWAKTYAPVSVTVDSDSDHHYESLYTATERQECDYDSFESDSDSEQSLDKLKLDDSYGDVENRELPKPPNAQPYGLIKFAGKHMRKLKQNFSIDFSKSLGRMTKRISRTDQNLPFSVKDEPSVPSKSNIPETNALYETSKSSVPKSANIYQNVDLSKSSTQKSADQHENQRISFLKKIRRSMSLSADSAFELTSNLANKPRSTFYLTETIDLDKNKDVSTTSSSSVSKSNIIRPRSPPPPAPISNLDENKKDIEKVTLCEDCDINNVSDKNSNSCWYAEVGLYGTPSNTPGTSTAENSGNTSINIIKSTDSINLNNDDYYNVKNKSHCHSENFNENEEKQSNKDDSLGNLTPDIQLLLQDEPLYQFYDAAVLESVCQDGISDFDSDNYEEVDDDNTSERSSNMRPTAMELVLPVKNTVSFTRTLWCEVPEVIQSAVLSKLSVRQKKLQEAKFEIITSEASYLNSLNVLNGHFASNIKKYVNEAEWELLFGKVIAVRTCSERLLQELEKCWQENILLYGICDIILKQAEENFSVYIHYCENQILLGDTLKQLAAMPSFNILLKELETSSSCQFLTLHSFLMLPMQRITRWPLLVDAVLKRLSQSDPEYLICQYALSSLNKIVSQCNEAARKKEREMELEKISKHLEFVDDITAINIVLSNRWLIRSGAVTNIQTKNDDSKMTFGKRMNKYQIYLYLFNDLFLVAKEKSCGIYTVLHYCPRNMVELGETDMSFLFPKKEGLKNMFFLTILENQEGKTVEFLLSCNKESDRERWIEAFTPPKSEDPEETLYECWDCPQVTATHNYNSVQPDELSLCRGDVINVLRKMGDGWYHGERIRDGQIGWFPANYTSEIVNPHVRARNLKQRYRLLAFSESYLKSN